MLNVEGLANLHDVSANHINLAGTITGHDANLNNVTLTGTITGHDANLNDVNLTGTIHGHDANLNDVILTGTIYGHDANLNDVSVNGDITITGNITVDGSFNFNEIIQNTTTINNTLLVSTQLDISNQGTGPALKVSQLGDGDDQDVALFNAGDEGDALKIDSVGNTFVYKDITVSGDLNANGGIKCDTDRFVVNDGTGNTTIAGTLGVIGDTFLQDLSCINFRSDTFRMGNFRYNINVPIRTNNISAGAFFIICLNAGGDNECVGRFFFNRSTGHDGAGIVDIVVSSRTLNADTPHGFCSYQTIGGPISSPSPLNFSIMSGTFSGVSYIGLKYEGGDAFPFSEVYFDGIWKSDGNNLPFDMKLNSEVTNQAALPIRAGVLSLQNKRIFIDKDGKVGIGTNTPSTNLDVNGTLNVTDAITGNLTGNVTGNVTGNLFGRASMARQLFRLSSNGGVITSSEGLPNAGGAIRLQGSSNNRQFITFYSSGGGLAGSIAIVDANVNYNRTSDYRIKHDIIPIENSTFKIKNLNPVTYYVYDSENRHEGFLAHEVKEIIPGAVTGNKDEVDLSGNMILQSLDTTNMIPYIVSSLKCIIEQVDVLEAEKEKNQTQYNELLARIQALEEPPTS